MSITATASKNPSGWEKKRSKRLKVCVLRDEHPQHKRHQDHHMGCASSSSSSPATGTAKTVQVPFHAIPNFAKDFPTLPAKLPRQQPSDLSSKSLYSTNSYSSPNPNSSSATRLLGVGPGFRIDTTLAKEMCTFWTNTFSISEAGEVFSAEVVTKDVTNLLRTWPRGNEAGQLLLRPISCSSNDIKSHGIKTSWLLAAWQHMTSSTRHNLCSTRMFIELLVRPLLSEEGTDCLLDYIPVQFRSESPHVFVSHAWDGMLKHILFFPENLKRQWPVDCGLWIDVFAVQQLDDGPNFDMVGEIKQLVRDIGTTVVVFPGDGTAEYALLPVLRSWCVFEMFCTAKDALQFRTGLHGDLNDADFHNSILAYIDTLSVQALQSTYESDDREILQHLRESGAEVDSMLKQWCKLAMARRYEAVPVTPNLARRISTASVRLSRFSSLSDIYLPEPKRMSSDNALAIKEHPDF